MANQVEVPKLTSEALVGPPEDTISVPKLVMYVLLTPGSGAENAGQGHVHTQVIVRRS